MLQAQKRPQLAAVITEHRKFSHAQHIVDRFLEGYGWNGAHHHPPMDLVALYVDQIARGDLSRERAARHPDDENLPDDRRGADAAAAASWRWTAW